MPGARVDDLPPAIVLSPLPLPANPPLSVWSICPPTDVRLVFATGVFDVVLVGAVVTVLVDVVELELTVVVGVVGATNSCVVVTTWVEFFLSAFLAAFFAVFFTTTFAVKPCFDEVATSGRLFDDSTVVVPEPWSAADCVAVGPGLSDRRSGTRAR